MKCEHCNSTCEYQIGGWQCAQCTAKQDRPRTAPVALIITAAWLLSCALGPSLCGCASTSNRVRVEGVRASLTWPDYAETMEGIECVLRKRFTDADVDRALAFDIVTVPDSALGQQNNCLTYLTQGTILVRDTYRNARVSCIRHELFAHVIVWIVYRETNRHRFRDGELVRTAWDEMEVELKNDFRECRR